MRKVPKNPKAHKPAPKAGKGKGSKAPAKVAKATTATATATVPTAKVTCSINVNFAVAPTANNFIMAVNKALLVLVPTVIVQLTANAVNWACNSNTGRPNCRVGGFYLYNNVLQLQIRWLQVPAIKYIAKHKLQVVNASHTLAKSNNLQLPLVLPNGKLHTANVQHAANLLHLQAQAYQAGTYVNSNGCIK